MGKMKEKYSHRRTFKRELTEWGETITCDHIYSASATALGLDGETESFVIKDLWSGLLHSFPVATKAATYVVHCIQQFVGDRKVQTLYSDNAKEFMGSCRELMMARDGGQPGVPHTNGIIERVNQLVIGGTSTCLIAAGLPPCYWSYGSPCFCFNLNTQSICGTSPWEKTHGAAFHGARYPFGCLVVFKPNEVRTTDHKWSPKAEYGVFAGYKLSPGYTWRGEYLVWPLKEFMRADLLITSTKFKQRGVASPHSTKCVELPETGLSFPLKADYERVNQSLFDLSVVNEDVDAITMAYPFDGPGRGLTILPHQEPHQSSEILGPEAEPEVPIDPLEGEQVAPPPVDDEEITSDFARSLFDHVRNGQPSDGVIYVDSNGQMVKIAKNGTPYRCDLDGVRNTMKSSRPSDIDPETWKIMGPYRDRLNKKAAKAAKAELQPQTAPVEGLLIKTEVLAMGEDPPNEGGASSSHAANDTEAAMPAQDHEPNCDCIIALLCDAVT